MQRSRMCGGQFASEYHLLKTKDPPEWDNFFRIVAETDPYAHLRSIYYCNVFTIIRSRASRLRAYTPMRSRRQVNDCRSTANRILFDECKYEVDIDTSWGNPSGHENHAGASGSEWFRERTFVMERHTTMTQAWRGHRRAEHCW